MNGKRPKTVIGEKRVRSQETVMSRKTVASNVGLLLRWIPAPALDPDPGSAGMTMHSVMPDLIRYPDVNERSWVKGEGELNS